MAAEGLVVSVGATPTLIFQALSGQDYEALTSPAENQFITGTPSDPLPIVLVFPASTSIFLGGADVAASGGSVGANINGVTSMTYNCTGADSLYGIVASSTAAVQVLAFRQ